MFCERIWICKELKTCRLCNKLKPLGEYHKESHTKDGRRSECKKCRCALRTQRYHKGKASSLGDSSIDSIVQENKSRREEKSNQRFKYLIRKVTRHAIRSGKMEKRDCEVCGASRVEVHHNDYNKPLDVTFLCHKHHVGWHRVFKPIEPDYNNGRARKNTNREEDRPG